MEQDSACSRRPGRREARREERRETILEAAQRSFMEQGYAGTTMSGIAGMLGGSKGTLWSYFPSKELLFAAVLDRVTRAFRNEMSVTLNPDDPVAEALTNFGTGFILKLSSPEAVGLYRLVMGEAGRFPEMGRIFYDRAPLPTLALLSDYLAGAMARGVLRRADPMRAAQVLSALCSAISHNRCLTGVCAGVSPAEAREQATFAIDLFLRSYAPASPAASAA